MVLMFVICLTARRKAMAKNFLANLARYCWWEMTEMSKLLGLRSLFIEMISNRNTINSIDYAFRSKDKPDMNIFRQDLGVASFLFNVFHIVDIQLKEAP